MLSLKDPKANFDWLKSPKNAVFKHLQWDYESDSDVDLDLDVVNNMYDHHLE